jgi:putative membrane protein
VLVRGRRLIWGAFAAGSLLWLARAVRAQGDEPARAAPPRPRLPTYAAEAARTASRLPPEERDARAFLRTAAQHARLEAEASRLAQERAGSESVRAYAADLLLHRQGADAELLHLLHGRGMALPMLESDQRKALTRLARAKGPRFDRDYLDLVLHERQKEALLHYQRGATVLADPQVREWAERQLDALRDQQAAGELLARNGAAAGAQPRTVKVRQAAAPR